MNSATIRSLMVAISGSRLTAKAREHIDALAAPLAEQMALCGIGSLLEVAHFLAQCAHESDGFRALEEYASGEAYEGRTDLGNTHPGDGVRFKGRGIFMLTGRHNYRRYGRRIGVDLEAEPQQASWPENAAALACIYWLDRGLALHAQNDNIEAVTRGINGGLNGLKDRKIYLRRAKEAQYEMLGLEAAPTPQPKPLSKSRTMKGAGIAGLSGVAIAASDLVLETKSQVAETAAGGAPDMIKYVLIGLVLIGAATAAYARWDDWRRSVK